MQLSLEWSKILAGQKHRGKDFRVVFLDVFLLSKFRSGASFPPKNHGEPVLNRMTLLVPNCSTPGISSLPRDLFLLNLAVWQGYLVPRR